MSTNWDTTFKLPRLDLSDRLSRVKAFERCSGLRTRILGDLLDHTDNNVYITIGGLVISLNITISNYRSGLNRASQHSLDLILPTLFQQLTEALLDVPEIRRVVLESLYDTNSIAY